MRVRTLFREAALNITTGTTRAALFCLAMATVIVVSGGAEIAVVADLDRRATDFQEHGGSTLVYRLKGGIDPTVCDRLGSLAGVSAAGALRQRDVGAVMSALPDQTIPAFDVSAGFGGFRALDGVATGDGVLVAEDVAKTLGITEGDPLPLTTGAPKVGGVFGYPVDGRLSGYGYSVLIPADSAQPYDECWAEAWPATDSLLAVIPTVLVPGATAGLPAGQGPQLKQLNASLGTTFDGAHAFETRITRFAPVVVAVFGFVVGCISVIRRRLELAAARHAGVMSSAQSFHVAVESFAWSAAAVVAASPTLAVLASAGRTESPESLMGVALWPVAAAVPAVLIGAVTATLCIRERHLFTYFKSR